MNITNSPFRFLPIFSGFILIITFFGCSGKFVTSASETIYDKFDFFSFPAINYFHPNMSPNEKWVIFQHIEPVSGWRTLLYTQADKEQKLKMPLPKLKKWQKVGRIALNKWSLSGNYNAFVIDVDCNRGDAGYHIVVVNFSSDDPKIIDFFKIGKDDFYWLDDEKLAYIDYTPKSGNSIVIKDYSNRESKAFHTGIKTRNFSISKNGTILFNKRVHGVKQLFVASLLDDEIHPKLIFKEIKADSYNLSPNGKYAIITTVNIVNHHSELTYALVNLQKQEVITALPVVKWPFQWSPDGYQIAYQKVTEIILNSSGKRIWPNRHFFIYDIITEQETDYGIGITDMFSWGPEGKHIVYSMKCIHPNLGHYDNGIFIMRVVDGIEIGRVSSISSNFRPTISQDGNYIIWDFLNKKTFFIKPNQQKEKMLDSQHNQNANP